MKRLKITVTILICFYSGIVFSQTKTLLHTFERHLLDKCSQMGVMNLYGERKEDYTIRLFSDSTFVITCFYTSTGNCYDNYRLFETAIGNFYNKDGVSYLVRNNPVFSYPLFSLRQINLNGSGPKKLEYRLAINTPVKIDYSDNGLALYCGELSMIFMKKNIMFKERM